MCVRCRAGTPVYMAPEVFRREYGIQSDMWSLGMMLYHFVSQRFPFWYARGCLVGHWFAGIVCVHATSQPCLVFLARILFSWLPCA